MPKGKPNWFDGSADSEAGSPTPLEPFIIGVAGGTASGKTTVCRRIIKQLNLPWVQIISMDNFYRGLTPAEHELAEKGEYDFDHPNAFDFDLLLDVLRDVRRGKCVRIPHYDFATHSRHPTETTLMYGADVVLIEGILVLHDQRVRDLMDMKVFVDTDADVRLARRITRDIRERGRTVDSVLAQYLKTVKPSFDQFCVPTKPHANLIIPHQEYNNVAVDLLAQHIRSQLRRRGLDMSAERFAVATDALPTTVRVMPRNKSLQAVHTVLRDASTSQEVFVNACDRLCRSLAEFGAATLGEEDAHLSDVTVQTPTGARVAGIASDGVVCAIAVVRGGEAMEHGLRSVLPDASIGKIVIQQPADKTLEPRMFYSRLPNELQNESSRVLLLDAVLGTGSALKMAARVLVEQGVEQERIVVLSLLAAPEGLVSFARAFPRIRVITTWVDDGLDNHLFVSPGLGCLGDRYFGTERDDSCYIQLADESQ
ncbi:MAG: hypothetical protein MHM6MM_003945 [Cercozoa sp. M6MM]